MFNWMAGINSVRIDTRLVRLRISICEDLGKPTSSERLVFKVVLAGAATALMATALRAQRCLGAAACTPFPRNAFCARVCIVTGAERKDI